MLFERHRLVTLPPADYARFVLDEEKCTGCGRCVNSCPIQLLMINENKKAQSNDRYDHFRCITCQNCVAACPQGAVTIEGEYRVPEGYWKNSHLFTNGKTLPLPIPDRSSYEKCEPELTETEKVIYNRRSIRLYKNKPVPAELVHRVIEAGRFAPSAGNNQPWKFIVIRNKALIDEIDVKCKKFCRMVMKATMPRPWVDKQVPGDKTAALKFWQKAILRLLIAFRGPNELDPRARGGINAIASDPDYHTFFHAPVLIILLADKRGIGSVELDTGICGQNMVLAAHSLGLGTCWVSLIDGLQGFPRFKKQLGITEPFEIVTSLTLGYPKGKIDNIVKREQARVVWHN
jgi:nitroreductase/NAD-dependent dihydropyrimidine dehydrogenase PreA subunit